ncbi:60S acidic ribosomal protein P2 [Xylographa trunciseda]|nr:60S acidic ribosomal protein P2 [Xylographa trunciseda]
MKHLAAYLLLGLGGNTEPSAEDIKGVLESVGIDADEERLEKLIAELKGKDLQELISEGSSKLASVPSGGGGGGGGGASAPAAGGAPGPAAEEEKPAEKEEEKEESDEDMGFGLFD